MESCAFEGHVRTSVTRAILNLFNIKSGVVKPVRNAGMSLQCNYDKPEMPIWPDRLHDTGRSLFCVRKANLSSPFEITVRVNHYILYVFSVLK